MRPARLAAVAAALAAGLAFDSAVAATATECHTLADAAARLACYDRATGRDAGATAPAAAPAAPTTATPATAAARLPLPRRPPPLARRQKAAPAAVALRPSMLGERWALDPALGDRDFDLRFHNSSYIIGRWSNDPNDSPTSPTLGGLPGPVPLDNVEAKFQFSFKARLWEADSRKYAVWAAYTQQSNWQIANGDLSRPFRETDYQPELIFTYRPDLEFGGVPLAAAQPGLRPPVERPRRAAVAQLEPDLRAVRLRARQLRAAGAPVVPLQGKLPTRTTTRTSPTTTATATSSLCTGPTAGTRSR